MVLCIGAHALVFGVLLVALSLRLRSWGRSGTRQLPTGGLPARA